MTTEIEVEHSVRLLFADRRDIPQVYEFPNPAFCDIGQRIIKGKQRGFPYGYGSDFWDTWEVRVNESGVRFWRRV